VVLLLWPSNIIILSSVLLTYILYSINFMEYIHKKSYNSLIMTTIHPYFIKNKTSHLPKWGIMKSLFMYA
jgi:hypothetical protein